MAQVQEIPLSEDCKWIGEEIEKLGKALEDVRPLVDYCRWKPTKRCQKIIDAYEAVLKALAVACEKWTNSECGSLPHWCNDFHDWEFSLIGKTSLDKTNSDCPCKYRNHNNMSKRNTFKTFLVSPLGGSANIH